LGKDQGPLGTLSCRTIVDPSGGLLQSLFQVLYPAGSPFSQSLLGRLAEIESVRPEDHRASAGGGLDQILPSQAQEAAT